ncbi:response regulator [Amycolatopsis anabasis]|uniref:response regulator n=1 Tax=Amycolatopsis anabasis TaxID=1840409 RepID=UPI00131D5EFA|nr:response regulator transcription factor [Amycolatopsis anabasis]
MKETRILIADDHTLLGNALAELLEAEPDLSVAGVAGSVDEALRLAAEHRPHVVLLDIEMPGNERPQDTVRRLQHVRPGVRVLVLTMHDDTALVRLLLAAGIAGFLHKTVTRHALVAAVRGARLPGNPVTVSLSANQLLRPEPAEPGPLSPREAEVIELVAKGLSNYQIARRLDIVEGTVKRHMRSIFDKLAARSRVEAANKAVQMGLIPSPVPVPVPSLRR